MSRLRKLLISAAVLAGVLVALVLGAGAVLWLSAETSNVGTLDFERELAIPPLLDPEDDRRGGRRSS